MLRLTAFLLTVSSCLSALADNDSLRARNDAIIVRAIERMQGYDYAGDELEEDKLIIEPVGKNRWLIDGAASLEDVNDELDLELEVEGADRIAGWVSAIAEHIPKTGEVVAAQGCKITVRRLRKNRITLVALEKEPELPVNLEDSL